MCGPYWSQWDRADLDSWQGKDLVVEDEDEDFDEDRDDEDMDDEEQGCSCGNVCMDCLGMSWRDFM